MFKGMKLRVKFRESWPNPCPKPTCACQEKYFPSKSSSSCLLVKNQKDSFPVRSALNRLAQACQRQILLDNGVMGVVTAPEEGAQPAHFLLSELIAAAPPLALREGSSHPPISIHCCRASHSSNMEEVGGRKEKLKPGSLEPCPHPFSFITSRWKLSTERPAWLGPALGTSLALAMKRGEHSLCKLHPILKTEKCMLIEGHSILLCSLSQSCCWKASLPFSFCQLDGILYTQDIWNCNKTPVTKIKLAMEKAAPARGGSGGGEC